MSEFKFACPVCGQHITADSSNSGGQLECPTCFQKIVIPQGPASDDAKFILSASQVGKPRPAPSNGAAALAPIPAAPERASRAIIVSLVVALLAIGVTLFLLRHKLSPSKPPPTQLAQPRPEGKPPPPPRVEHPIPTNIAWMLDLTNAAIPDAVAAGSIHGSGFLCESATLQGGALSLRQGKGGPPDLGITIRLFAEQGEELSGKAIEIAATREPPLPRVTLRWKNEQQESKTQNINEGYTMKLAFGPVDKGRISGKIYICLPDDAKSFVAGTFDARIRKPSAPKPKG